MRTNGLIQRYAWLQRYVAAERSRPRGAELPPAALRTGITFDRVSFRYPGTDRVVLDEVSMHLRAGTVTAIVGEYGSGKSTVVKLLSKFYRPTAGVIRVDDTDLAQLDTRTWRDRSSAAYQDFGRYEQTTLREAVGLGDLAHLDDTDQVLTAIAVADADADAVVASLPDGLDTTLGRVFGGVDLSEGQWQKTALARAAMRANLLLYVLDEPTASLDPPSERAVFDRYMEHARALARGSGTVTVVISHRFCTVTEADVVLVLDRGRLVESGSHQELMARNGHYRRMYDIHAAAYRDLPVQAHDGGPAGPDAGSSGRAGSRDQVPES